jgi:hypothetical protein
MCGDRRGSRELQECRDCQEAMQLHIDMLRNELKAQVEINFELLEACQKARMALRAPRHGVDDFNCPDSWEGCKACDGDEQCREVVKLLDTILGVDHA